MLNAERMASAPQDMCRTEGCCERVHSNVSGHRGKLPHTLCLAARLHIGVRCGPPTAPTALLASCLDFCWSIAARRPRRRSQTRCLENSVGHTFGMQLESFCVLLCGRRCGLDFAGVRLSRLLATQRSERVSSKLALSRGLRPAFHPAFKNNVHRFFQIGYCECFLGRCVVASVWALVG